MPSHTHSHTHTVHILHTSISRACELHLQAKITDPKSIASIHKFLSAGQSPTTNDNDTTPPSESNTTVKPTPRLFVWIPRRRPVVRDDEDNKEEEDESDDEGEDVAMASTELFDGNNMGALAFVNTAIALTGSGGGNTTTLAPIRSMAQVQCMTLAPRIYPEAGVEVEDNADAKNEEKEDAAETDDTTSSNNKANSVNPGSSTFLSLQLYARHCFVPAIQAIEALSDQPDDDDEPSPSSPPPLV